MSEELTVSKIRLRLSYDSSGVSAEMITPASEPVHKETDITQTSTTEMRKKSKKANTSRHCSFTRYRYHMSQRTQLPPKRGTAPPFSANVRSGQTVGWIKMRLGTEIGLGPAPPPQKKPPNFWPMSIVANRLDRSRCHLIRRYRPRPRRQCVTCGPAVPPKGYARQFSAHVYCGPTVANFSLN